MAQLSSLKSVISGTSESEDSVGRMAGFGNIFGILAAVVGLIAGTSLVPIPSIQWEVTSEDPFVWILSGSANTPLFFAGFMGLMALSMLLQVLGKLPIQFSLDWCQV
ncbi:MAG: hypothetical protein ACFFEE_12485 [Candidatus Thorarchaeota archaeon]